jgi:two-component system sensor histidine kinase BaeS
MKFSLRTKLTAAFLVTTLILFALVSIFANVILEKQFNNYVINQQEQKNNAIISTITTRYIDWGGKWDPAGMESIGVNALENGQMLRFTDSSGAVLWDAMIHNSGMCASIINNMSKTMQTRYMGFQGGYTEKLYPILIDGKSVGSVAVGFYGPYYYSANDILFLDSLNRLLKLAGLLALLISFVLGAIMAKQLSKPIKEVIDSACKITKGDYKGKIAETSSTTEIRDLTATFNALSEALEKQEALRKRLTADVAHELRTPLATLQSHMEAMLDGVWELDANRLKSCHEETVRLTKIVGELEALTRYESENMILIKTNFDLSETLQRIIASFESAFKTKKIFLSLDASTQFIEADEDKVSQILVNILSNALKFTPEEGRIDVLLTGSDKFVEIKVRDSGIGIAEDDIPYIYERFFRGEKSRNQKTGGSGIGLAIVKTLVDAHHGTIEVKSQIGQGSEFIVTLPKK